MDFIKNKLSYKVTKMQDFIPFLTVKQDTIPIEVRPYSEDVIPVFKKTLFLASIPFLWCASKLILKALHYYTTSIIDIIKLSFFACQRIEVYEKCFSRSSVETRQMVPHGCFG